MAKLILLGTGAALSDAVRENMYLVVQGNTGSILVDVAGSPVQRLLQARVSPDSIEHIILTHYHPDHLYGLPILLMDLWLLGRKKTLHLYGLEETIRVTRALLEAFDWQAWHTHGFYPTEFHVLDIPKKGIGPALETSDFKITATRTEHFVPTIALKFVPKSTGRTIVYSSDTQVSRAIVELARDADLLIHEASTIEEPSEGHTSALQAGEQAQRAGAKELMLVHLPPNGSIAKLRAAAKRTFEGKVVVGKDFMQVRF